MISDVSGNERINDLKNLNLGLYGDNKAEIRKVVINQLEKHLFKIDVTCIEEYLNNIVENENSKEGKFLLFIYFD